MDTLKRLRVLVVEDEETLADNLRILLASWGYEVVVCHTGVTAITELCTDAYDLALLDVGLPDTNGFAVCSEYRKAGGKALIIFLTGRDCIQDKLEGFTNEADDYICKPYNSEELKARVEAIMRRAGNLNHDVLTHNEVCLNPRNHVVTYQSKSVSLAPIEFALLEFLMRYAPATFSAEQLLERVWRSDAGVSTESVRSAVRGVRKKLQAAGCPEIIQNVPAIGYRLSE
jgi:DNA-binding response OmpR family regulator